MSLGIVAVLCQASVLAQQIYVQTNPPTGQAVVQPYTTNVVVQPYVTNAPPPEEEHKHFHSLELDVSPFGVYVDKLNGAKWGGGAALTFYPIENLGIGASTYWVNFKGTTFDNVEGEAYLRVPLFQVVAPYAVGGFGYQFGQDYTFETVGLGIDFRPLRHVGLFSDGKVRISNRNSIQESGAMVRIGLRFSF
jgi:hypothetical protein